MNKQYNPAGKYMAALAAEAREEQFMEWSSYLPETWCRTFCTYGLIPFLKEHGYILGCSSQQLYDHVTEWAFAHVLLTTSGPVLKTRRFMDCYHSGGEEEHDWFLFKISSQAWMDFAKQWSATGFLDDSDAGYSQSADLPIFVWNLIQLDSSKSHQEWLQYNDIMNYQDEIQGVFHSNTEDGPFGGERR
jgi:hypothetical protein